MSENVRENASQIGSFIISSVAVLTANQESIEWGLKCCSYVVAIVAGLFSIWSFYRKAKSGTRAPFK